MSTPHACIMCGDPVDGSFTVAEADDILNSFLDGKRPRKPIFLHKVRSSGVRKGQHHVTCAGKGRFE